MAKKREIKYASDPVEEKIEQVFKKFERAVPARFTALWGDTRAEVVSAIPLAPPVGYVKQPSLSERIRAMVRSEHLRAAAEGAGYETFEESEDFEVGEDYDPRSPYEEQFDPGFSGPNVPPAGVGEPAGKVGGAGAQAPAEGAAKPAPGPSEAPTAPSDVPPKS